MATVNTCEIIEKLCEPLVLSHTDARQSKRKYTHSKSSSSSSTTSSESSSSSSDSAISEGKQWELFEEKLRKNSFGIHAKDRDFELDMHDRRDLLTCTHELIVHHLDEEDESGWDDDGVHTVVHSRYCMADLTATQKSKSFSAPDELRALLNPAGEPNLTEVITREQIKLYGTVADTIIDCMPPASQFGVYGRVQEDGNPTYALLVLHAKTLLPLGGARESRFLESSGHFPLWRSIVMFSNVFQSDTSPWEAKNCASILPPAVASSFMQMRQGGHQHLAGVAAHASLNNRTCFEMHDLLHDPNKTSDSQAVFRAWQTDAKHGVGEIPSISWRRYYNKDIKRISQIPITNWWCVYHSNDKVRIPMKEGAVVKPDVFFDLMLQQFIECELEQVAFTALLYTQLMDICKKLKESDLRRMATIWEEANMLVVQCPMHTRFVQVYQHVNETIGKFLETNEWDTGYSHFTPPSPPLVSMLLEQLEKDLQAVRGGATAPRCPTLHTAVPHAIAELPVTQTATSLQLSLITNLLEQILEKLT